MKLFDVTDGNLQILTGLSQSFRNEFGVFYDRLLFISKLAFGGQGNLLLEIIRLGGVA